MNGSPQFRAVVTAPMENGVGIDHAIPRLESDGHAAGQWHAVAFKQCAILGIGIASAVAAGHNPQNVVIVKRYVPLNRAHAVCRHIRL